MSSASEDRGHLMIDGWGSSWDVGPDISSGAAGEIFSSDHETTLAHWGGVEAGEAWSEQVWDDAAWGAAALHVDTGEADAEPLWPSRAPSGDGLGLWTGVAPSALHCYKAFDRPLQEMAKRPVPTQIPVPSRIPAPASVHPDADPELALALPRLMAESARWPFVARRADAAKAATAKAATAEASAAAARRDGRCWPAGGMPRVATSARLTARPRGFGPAYPDMLQVADRAALAPPTAAPVSVPQPLPAPTLGDGLTHARLTVRDRVFGPQPPESVQTEELREALRRRPRVGRSGAAGALAIGALFDALATEREAAETLDRLATLERSSAEAAEAAALARACAPAKCAGSATAVALLDDVSFASDDRPCAARASATDASRADAAFDDPLFDDLLFDDPLFDDPLLADAVFDDDGEMLDPFSRPLSAPPVGSLTASLLVQLRMDLGRQARPRRRVAAPAPSGRRAS